MNGITWYVFRQLATGMILVAAGLTCVIWLTQSLRFVEMIVNRGLSVGSFVYLTMLLLPNFLVIIMPVAIFAIVVFSYSKMIGDRELVVMRATGMSQLMLATPALLLAAISILVSFALNLYFVPKSYQQFREMQWDIRYSYSHVMLREGAFSTMSPWLTVYVRERTKTGELKGILVHDSRNASKPATMMAERGALVATREGPRVVMFNGNRQEVDQATHKMAILYFDRYSVDLGENKEEEVIRYREPRERMLDELFDVDKDELLNPRDYGKFKVEAHKRLASPFHILGFTLIGVACMISGGIARRGQGRRIALAVGLIVSLQALYLGLDNLCAKRLELVPLMYVAALVPSLFGFLAMFHYPRRRRGRAAAAAG